MQPTEPPTEAAAVTLDGRLEAGRLHAQRVTWWTREGSDSAEVPAPPPGAVLLPD